METIIPEKEIKKAIRYLKKGKAVVYPTETCYGLGVCATNKKAVERLYRIKDRPENQPTHILVKDVEMAGKYVEITDKIGYLTEKFPEGLTIILPTKQHVPKGIKKIALQSSLLGFRIARNPISQSLIEGLGKPITAASANLKGWETPFSIKESLNQLSPINGIFFLNGGTLEKKRLSTIVFIENKTVSVIREGLIPFWEIDLFWKNVF